MSMFWLEWLLKSILPFEQLPEFAPEGMMIIFVVSIAAAAIGAFAQRLLVDVHQVRRWSREVGRWRKIFNEALSKKDKKQRTKAQSMMMKFQRKMLTQTFKGMIVSMPLYLIVYFGLASLYGTNLVAKLPFSLPSLFGITTALGGSTYLTFLGWYIVTMTAVGGLFFRLAGVRVESGE